MWNEADLRRYAVAVYGLKKSTWERRRDYLAMLAESVDMQGTTDTIYEAFLSYVERTRLTYGRMGDNRVRNMRAAVQLLFSFFGVRHSYEWPRTHDIKNLVVIPTDDVVYGHIHSPDLHENAFMNRQLNYISHLCYVLGPRPSAIAGMKVSGIDFEHNEFTYFEPKVSRYRRVFLPEFVVRSPVDKSLQNWVRIYRNKTQTGTSGDFLWLTQDGTPFEPEKLRLIIAKHNKKLWAPWKPYHYRHVASVRYLLAGYNKFGIIPVYELMKFLDHQKIDVTIRYYVNIAEHIIKKQQKVISPGRIEKQKKIPSHMPDHDVISNPAGPTLSISVDFHDTTCFVWPVVEWGDFCA